MFRIVVALFALTAPAFAQTTVHDAIAAPGAAPVATLHGVGAQIYECKADAGGKLGWKFREPVATLIANGKTVGRHYIGPTWALDDGGVLVGRVFVSAPGTTPADIAWLKLTVASHGGAGLLDGVTTVLRINTQGGAASGGCDTQGDSLTVPYEADYVFLK